MAMSLMPQLTLGGDRTAYIWNTRECLDKTFQAYIYVHGLKSSKPMNQERKKERNHEISLEDQHKQMTEEGEWREKGELPN